MSNTCYYCQLRIADSKYTKKITLYNKLGSEYGLGLTGVRKTTRYYEMPVEIDRCGECYAAHHAANKPALYIGIATFLVVGAGSYLLERRIAIALTAAIVASLVMLFLYFYAFYRKKLRAMGIRDEYNVKEFPQVKEHLQNGWSTIKP